MSGCPRHRQCGSSSRGVALRRLRWRERLRLRRGPHARSQSQRRRRQNPRSPRSSGSRVSGRRYRVVRLTCLLRLTTWARRSAASKGSSRNSTEGVIRVYGASDLARWLSEHPGLAAGRFEQIGWLATWDSYDAWAAQPFAATPFHPDAARAGLMKQLATAARNSDRFVHVAGRAGDGKTRLVLEALREPDCAGRTLYLPQQRRRRVSSVMRGPSRQRSSGWLTSVTTSRGCENSPNGCRPATSSSASRSHEQRHRFSFQAWRISH